MSREKSPLTMYNSAYFRAVVRAIQVLPKFDRIQLSVIGTDEEEVSVLKNGKHKVKEDGATSYRSISRVIAQLKNEGYIELTGDKTTYSVAELKRNPDLTKRRITYGTGNLRTAESYKRSLTWPSFMTRWHAFLKGQEIKNSLSTGIRTEHENKTRKLRVNNENSAAKCRA